MQYAIEIKNLCKQYPKFALQSVSFTLPMGYIMGFIGENGAGKTTVMKSMLHLVRPDSGTVLLLGQDATKENAALKQQIGVVLDTANFPQSFTTQDVHQMLKRVYSKWDGALYQQYLEQFHLPEKKKFKEFSMGMKKKLAVAAALAHHPKLLILDEVTAGLDPMVREEILDVFRDFVSDGEHSILISSHIISDLEKICDYITFLHEGTVLFSMERDTLLDTYCMVQCTAEDAEALMPEAICGRRETPYHAELLCKRDLLPSAFEAEPANIEDIMVFLTKYAVGGE